MAAPQPAPTRSRGLSVKSEQSQNSANSSKGHQRGPSESSQEKHRRNLQTKADPLVAMNELQPIAVALQKSNLGSLREIEHKDQFGNVITDPDLSNPTRPRFERPLDTIRSFEAAIYGAYRNNRGSYARTDAASQMGDFSRRTSYYGPQNGNGNGAKGYGNRHDQGHYSQAQSRPDSIINAYSGAPQSPEAPNPYPYNYQNGNGNGNGNSRRRPNHRSPSYPASPSSPTSPSEYPNMAQNVNPQYGYQANGYQANGYFDNAVSNNSGSDPHGHSTDPSSINSSNDQLQQQALQQQRLDERAQAEYGFTGFGNNNIAQPDPSWAPASGSGAPAPQPPVQAPRPSPVREDTNSSAKGDKRKSWFKRRFSKD
ncbi:unnamed protein product [Penicillium salamii]|uniref:Uncharacterized protein n=1 Tax=Penicillium salamii TaxID=1612424 RepID=A0A9W4JHV1_9EURO|nr:unnamed protein product [Penicillium salamii]